MNKTLSIGLAGFSFIIDEHAYIKLNDYLSALRKALEPSEAEEVMNDIEIRIVEILKHSMNQREIINNQDIEKVILQLGKPEDIEEQGETYLSDRRTIQTDKQKKQLFRDPENTKIGGVCSGLAYYLGIEVTWMRLIWIAAFFLLIALHGNPFVVVILYIILWVVVPYAKNTSDFLKMKGRPVNFDTIKEESAKMIEFTKDSNNDINRVYGENKYRAQSTARGLGNFFRIVFGVFLGFISFCLLISSLATFVAVNAFSYFGFANLQFYLEDALTGYLGGLAVFLVLFIPAILFGIASIKLISPQTKMRNTKYVVGTLGGGLLLVSAYLGIKISGNYIHYSGEKTETEELALDSAPDSIFVGVKPVNIPPSFTAYPPEIYSDKKEVYEKNPIFLEIKKNDEVKTPYLKIKKEAKGYNIPLRLQTPIEIRKNNLRIPNFIKYPFKDRFRDYKVSYELIVPEKTKITTAPNSDLIVNNKNTATANHHVGILLEKREINLNGFKIKYDSRIGDSLEINGKNYSETEADLLLKKKIKMTWDSIRKMYFNEP
ncbi:MAG: PspC domain-containing protein [Bergeyella sp.]|nr:PspC domain-containing protein [Bergeyella sp.]